MLPGASMVSYMAPLYQIARSHKEATPRPRTCSPAPKTMSNLRGKSEQSQQTRANWPPEPEYTDASGELVAKAVQDEAKQASEEIDHSLSVERSRRRKDRAIRIVLLGQSESGKSTTLRNFQLNLAPKAFQDDAEAWRTIIHLNLLFSVNFLLDLLKGSLRSEATSDRRPPYSPIMTPSRQLIEREKSRLRGLDGPTSAPPYSRSATSSPTPVSTELRRLMLSLMPLKSIEATLRQRLGAEEPDESLDQNTPLRSAPCPGPSRTIPNRHPPFDPFVRPASALSSASTSSSSVRSRVLGFRRHSVSSSNTSSAASSAPAPVDFTRHCSSCSASEPSGIYGQEPRHVRRNSRIHSIVDSFAVKVRGSTGWKRRARLPEFPVCDERELNEDVNSTKRYSRRNSFEQMSEQDKRDLLAARQIIQVFGEDINRLWTHPDVQDLLRRKDIRLENRPGFFLDDVLRVTAYEYIPTTDDILRARLTTTGVEEHRLVIEKGPDCGMEWIIYDVGGFRSQRAAWAPFFDSVNAIIFLAPISSFDEWLAEDPTINRLEDTYLLWREICSLRVLASVDCILFFNKYDILRSKLKNGIRFSDYVVNYDDEGGKKNTAECIAKYMLSTFHAAHKDLSPRPRRLRAYLTSVIDSNATAKVVRHISEQVLLSNMATAFVV